jgi:uncharacterized protein (TIGR00725 family)
MRRTIIGVFGAGERASEADVANGRLLGELIAREGWVVLTGGRDAGVMRATADGAKSVEGSLTIGVLPHRDTVPPPSIDIAIVTDLGSGRNNVNVLTADVCVACGASSAGTLSEIALAVKAGKPLVVVGAAGEETFLSRIGRVEFAGSPAEAIVLIRRLLEAG